MFFQRRKHDSRGQALVETVLVLPILVLLLVVAADFGRVFFGWIALTNAARVGADYAAQEPTAWELMAPEEQDERDRYIDVIMADIRTMNCDLVGGTPSDPTWADGPDADPGSYDDGDYAIVDLECSFTLMTPLAGELFGGAITLAAQERFPIHRDILQGVPSPPALPSCEEDEAEVPNLIGKKMSVALTMWEDAGFDPDLFSPEVTPPPGNANKFVTTQSLDQFECAPLDAPLTVMHT